MTIIRRADRSVLVYRAPELADLPDIQMIDAAAFRDRYPYFVLRQLLDAHSSSCVVAVKPDVDGEDKIVGYALTIGESGRAWLVSLAVSADHRREGYGWGLLQHTVDVCRQKENVNDVLLTVDPNNEPAYRMFKEFGFVLQECDERYFAEDEPRHVLTYSLRTGDAPRVT